MNKTFIIFVLLSSIGCKSTGPYWSSRVHDLADIVSVTVGIGGGAKAMAGPFRIGLFENSDLYGIRNGVVIPSRWDSMDLDHFILPIGPIVPIIPRNPPIFGFSGIVSRTCNQGEMVYTFPLFSLPEPHFLQGRPKWAGGEGPFYQPVLIHDNKHAMQYLTQLELAGGLGVTLRLGINPGEIIDFFAGIFGFDIYLDDDVQKDKET